MIEPDFSVFDLISPLVVLLDREGRIVRWNRACSERTGWSLEEVRGRLFSDFLLPEEQVEEVRGVFLALREGQFPSHHVNEWLTRTGERRQIVWSNSALLGANGEVEYVIGTGVDVTDRAPNTAKARDHTPHPLRSPFAMWIVDRGTLGLLAVNDAAVDRYGHTREELLSKTLTDICAIGDLGALAEMLTELRPDVMWSGPCHHRRKDGTLIECEMGVLPMDFAGRPAAMVLVRERP